MTPTTTTTPAAGTKPTELRRELGTRDLVLIVIGCVIGSGIFIVPSTVLKQSGGDVGPMLLVWVLGGVLSLLGALTYGELGAMSPEAGGMYVWVRDAFGRFPAFLLGWTFFFCIGSGAVATLSVAFAAYCTRLVPLGPVAQKAVALLMIAVIAAVNVRGTRQSAGVQNVSTVVKVGALVLMSALLLALGAGLSQTAGHVWPARFTPGLLSGLGAGMIGVLWAYEGWQYATFSAGEVKDPGKTLPPAIGVGTLAVVLLYLLANVAYLGALSPEAVMGSNAVAADAVGTVLGGGAAKLVAAAVMVSIFSAANGVTLTAPRAAFRMAQDGLFFRGLGEVHPRFLTPARAIIASAVWAALLAATGTFERLLTYVVFTGWIFYALAAASLLVLRRTRPDAPRPFRVPGYPWTPILFVVAAAAIVLNTLLTQPLSAAIGLAIVFVGTPFYWLWSRRA